MARSSALRLAQQALLARSTGQAAHLRALYDAAPHAQMFPTYILATLARAARAAGATADLSIAAPWMTPPLHEQVYTSILEAICDGVLRTGDRIIAIGEDEITDLVGLWRRVWACGSAGAPVRLRLGRDSSTLAVTVRSADRASFLKSPKLH